jgi:hypothetical protein
MDETSSGVKSLAAKGLQAHVSDTTARRGAPGFGAFLPSDATVYLGSGLTSGLVNFTSPGGGANINVPGCGHDIACIIANSPDLQQALLKAGQCRNPLVISRTKNGVSVSANGGGGGGTGGNGGGLSGLPGGDGPPGLNSPMIPFPSITLVTNS